MTEVNEAIALFGTDEPRPQSVVLRAGPLSVELENGALRFVRYAGVQALQSIVYLVRDANWATPAATIENQRIEQRADGFGVAYEARATMSGATFTYRAEITGTSEGALRFQVIGRADADMIANRVGFCVLHPLEGVAGEPVEVTHGDGSVERTRFPRLISPAQPMFDIRALAHEVVPGVMARCTMEGDAFEMEDHRNWMDASFKTYIRPLSKPKPFTVAAGEELVQSVALEFEGEPRAVTPSEGGPVTVTVGGERGTMPAIGLYVPPDEAEVSLTVQARLEEVRPSHLLGHLDLREPAHGEALRHLASLADALGAPVMLEIVLPNLRPPAEELDEAARLVAAAGLQPEAVHAAPQEYLRSWQPAEPWPEVPPLEEIYAAAREAFPGARIGGGMLSYFTELNRKRPPAAAIDFVSHSACPLVHDADDRIVMDNVGALPWIAESVRAIVPNKPYHLGPVLLAMRWNPYGKAPIANPENRRLAMATNDPRQQGLFGAAWHLGVVAQAARSGVEALTLAAPTGAFGMVHRPLPWPQPAFDGRGGVYPLFHVIRGLASGVGRPALELALSSAERVLAVGWQEAGGAVLWLANPGEAPVTVEVGGLGAQEGMLSRLDLEGFYGSRDGDPFSRSSERWQPSGIELGPFAIARLTVPT
jgi:D-apionolactonase